MRDRASASGEIQRLAAGRVAAPPGQVNRPEQATMPSTSSATSSQDNRSGVGDRVSVPRIRIPATDLSVSPMALGSAQFGTGIAEDASFALLDTWIEEGANLVDSAHVYNDFSPGAERSSSEKVIGRWRRARGETGLIVSSKGGHPQFDNPDVRRINAREVRRDLTGSLENLGLDHIDLYYLHRDDPSVPVDEVLGMLEEFRSEGLIRYYASSNWSLERLIEATETAKRLDYSGFVANQTEWSLPRRNPGTAPGTSMDLTRMDDAMIAFHARTGMAVVAYWSQAKGYLDKYLAGTLDAEATRCYDSPLSRAIADTMAPIALRLGASPTQLMLAAQIRMPFFSTIPIVGCRTPAQIRSSLRSIAINVSDDDLQTIYEAAHFRLPLQDG
jgi:aryl-alcohol dehydrogenase-like predicted oxidoreductase